MKDNQSADYTGFSLVSGGLIYSLTKFIRGKGNERKGRIRTAIFLAAIIWIPLCVMAVFEGTLNDTDQTIDFFEDFLMHVRFLFVVPFLILIEKLVDESFIGYIQNTDRIISIAQQDRFNSLVARLNKLTDSFIPEILVLIVIYSTIIINWDSLSIFSSHRNYLAEANAHTLNIAGGYYLLICSPIFQLLIFRWLWRWVIWLYSLIKISKFDLQIDPLHADKMGGLEYLNIVPLAISYILIAPSAVLSAHVGMEIIYSGASLRDFVFPIIIYVFLLPVVLYLPMVLFVPYLVKAKAYGIQSFGNLIRRHNKSYAKIWIEGDGKEGEQLLGTMDNSSLADINGSYGPVQGMQIFPINLKFLIMSFVMNIIPYIPLIFTYYTAMKLFQTIVESAVGV